MPLVRLSTKLDQVVKAANQLRNRCKNLAVSIQAAPLQPHVLRGLYEQCGLLLLNVVPFKDDASLATYADQQFGTAMNLPTLLTSVGQALTAMRAEIETLAAPHQPGVLIPNNGLSVVIVDSKQVVIAPLAKARTTGLLAMLQGIVAAIPE